MLVNKSIVQTWTNALANDHFADVELQVLVLKLFVAVCYMKSTISPNCKTVVGSQFFLHTCACDLVSLVMSGSLMVCLHLSPIMHLILFV